MPAIKMTAEVTSIVNENGRSNDIVATGPRPGSTPTIVPTNVPTKQ